MATTTHPSVYGGGVVHSLFQGRDKGFLVDLVAEHIEATATAASRRNAFSSRGDGRLLRWHRLRRLRRPWHPRLVGISRAYAFPTSRMIDEVLPQLCSLALCLGALLGVLPSA